MDESEIRKVMIANGLRWINPGELLNARTVEDLERLVLVARTRAVAGLERAKRRSEK